MKDACITLSMHDLQHGGQARGPSEEVSHRRASSKREMRASAAAFVTYWSQAVRPMGMSRFGVRMHEFGEHA
jgi:hypothetical protein